MTNPGEHGWDPRYDNMKVHSSQ